MKSCSPVLSPAFCACAGLLTLAPAFANQQESWAALEILSLNLDRFPKSARTYRELAGVYEQLGDEREALANYTRSAELNPRDTRVQEALKRLGG